jgi:N-acetylglucosaminyl-diphospho-decaprenol L-rhamnosyltransferase
VTSLAILVVSYNSAAELGPFLESVRRGAEGLAPDMTVETSVIENSAEPEQIELTRAVRGWDRIVVAERNLGYGAGMNRLATDAGGDWLLICNPDIRFRRGSLAELLAAAHRHPRAALVGPQVRGSDDVRYPSARRFPSLRTGAGHVLFGRIWPSNPWTQRYHFLVGTAAPEQAVDWLSGACLLVRREAFDAVGGFDEGFFMYFEDVDLAMRLRAAGWGAVYAPDAVIEHSGAHSTRRHSALMWRVHHESARRYLRRKYRGWFLAPVRWVLTFGLFVRRELGARSA